MAIFSLRYLNGVNGFKINGIDAGDRSGISVSPAGDINGDGYDDILIEALTTDPSGRAQAGESYVVFGSSGWNAASLNLADLNGSNGFRIDGIDEVDEAGLSVSSAGDVNGDGVNDILIGAPKADPNGVFDAGRSYVVFGSIGWSAASVDLAALDGRNGFRIDGIASGDLSGADVSSAGDVNGDGIDDILIGAPLATPNGNALAGESYVVFGSSGWSAASVDLAALDGSNGFRIEGIYAGDRSGRTVSAAGDVNGDGIDDILIVALNPDPNGNAQTGESYVVFGSTGWSQASVNLADLNGSNGFRIDGIDPGDQSGLSVASAGDVNGDGINDILIGAPRADPNGNIGAGESYVVFGSSGWNAASVDLAALDGSNGFRIDGISVNNASGSSVSTAGDVNGDGIDDILIGAPTAHPNGALFAGQSYVLFGSRGWSMPSVNLAALDGSNGFRIDGIASNDQSGRSVSAAGDVNGDGFDDILIGAPSADPNGFERAGETYILFGSANPGLNAPTGSVLVSGEAVQNATLFADASSVADADGLGTLDYQWRRNGVDIEGATSTSYVLTQSDVGAEISATVSYIDLWGNAESVTSSATVPVLNVNDAPTGAVQITGDVFVTGTVAADTSTLADEDGLGPFSYQWKADGVDISGAISDTYTLTQAEVGKAITVNVSYTDGGQVFESVTSSPTVGLQNSYRTNDERYNGGNIELSAGAIDATNFVPTEFWLSAAQTAYGVLTATAFGDADFYNLGQLKGGVYRIYLNTDVWDSSFASGGEIASIGITDQNSAVVSSPLVVSDLGRYIELIADGVSFYTVGLGNGFAENTEAVQYALTLQRDESYVFPEGQISLIGDMTEGEVLRVVQNIVDEPNLRDFTYEWYANGFFQFAGGSFFPLGPQNVGQFISVRVFYTNSEGGRELLGQIDAQTAVENINNDPGGVVTIVGSRVAEGQVLAVDTTFLFDGDGVGAFEYQWQRDGVDVAGATAANYTLTQADVGLAMSVVVSYIDGQGTAESVVSVQTGPVANVNNAPTGGVVITGDVYVTGTVTADTTTLADEDGLGSLSYQWYADGVAVANATGSTLTLTEAEKGKVITVDASYTDGFGFNELVSSDATTPVLDAITPPLNDVVLVTTTVTHRFGQAVSAAEVSTTEITNGNEVFLREVSSTDAGVVFELVAAPRANVFTLDFEFSDNMDLISFQLGQALEGWTIQTNTAVANTVTVSGFGALNGSQDIVAGAETVLATFETVGNPDVDVMGIFTNGVAQQDLSIRDVPATSKLANVTVHEVTNGADVFVSVDKPVDLASENAVGAFDALQALRLAVGLTKSDGTAEWHDYFAADINRDGRVGADDALNILKYAVGLTDGPAADWVFVLSNADHSGVTRQNSGYEEGVPLPGVFADINLEFTGILVGDVDGSFIM